MRKTFIVIVLIVAIIGGLGLAAKLRAPKPAQPTTAEMQAKDGIPVEVDLATRGKMEQIVEITGDINALDKVILSAKIAGRVLRVNAREGDNVSRGSTVITLDQQDAASNREQAQAGLQTALIQLSQAKTNAKVTRIQTDAAIAQAQASLEAAKAKLTVVKNPARNQERLVAENNVASAKANLDNAESNYKRNQSLLKDGAISAAAFDVIKSQFLVAQAQHKSAKQQLSMITEGGRTEDILSASSQVDVAKEQLRTAKANASQNLLRAEDVKSALAAVDRAKASLSLADQMLANTYVKSPISGQISSRTTEPGQVVAPGQALAEVVNMGSLYFKGDVSEKEITNLNPGQPVRVIIDAMPERTFSGVVDKIFPSGSTVSRNFPVRIAISNNSHLIRAGMFVRGQVVVGMDTNVLLVPKDAVLEREGSKIIFTVQSVRDHKNPKISKMIAKRHNVSVIRENSEYAEIADSFSISAGDEVVTTGRQNLQEGSLIAISNRK